MTCQTQSAAALPMTMPAGAFSSGMQQIGQLIEKLEDGSDPQTRDLARRLTQAMLDIHREGLAKIWTILEEQGASAESIRQACLTDPLVSNLLVLHDLHPVDRRTRVEQALAKVGPRLNSQGGSVTLLTVAEDAVHLRLDSGCGGCPSAAQTLRQLVENALCETAADVESIVWETPSPAKPSMQGFVPVDLLAKQYLQPRGER